MHGKHELDCDPGSVTVGSPPAADGFDLRIQKTPAPGLVCHDVARETSGDRRWAPLVEASFADFKEAMEDGDTARSTSLVKLLAELALIERGMIAAGSRRGLRALRVARLSLARRSITRHLSQASLSPAMVADLLGVSVRHMHMLFEGTGQSFSRTVTAQRIPPERPVAPRGTRAADRRGRPRQRIRESGDVLSGLSCDRGDAPGASSGRETLNQGRISLLSSTTRQRLI
jgi:AraC-like DNA-binding protein